jgi:DNA replication protein DnaC
MRTGNQTLQHIANQLQTKMQPVANLPHRYEQIEQPGNQPVCETCGDDGFYRMDLPVGHPQYGKLIRCACKANEDAARLQRLSGLTELERTLKLSDIKTENRPQTRHMVSECTEFLKRPYGFLTIHGTSGNAKTVALQACVNAMVGRSVEAVYITAFDLISYIRDAFTDNNEIKDDSAYDRIVRFGTVAFLAIDELDKVKWTDWVQEQVTDLIDRRYRLGCDMQAGTMLAMNGNPRDLPAWIYSRISQSEIVRNDDPDLRPFLKG